MTHEPPQENRIAALCALIEAMTSHASHSIEPPIAPAPPKLSGNPAQLAIDSAKSATAIAHAVAQLGHGNDQQQAVILWKETLNQMERIQALYHLPALPFQSQPLPPGAS